MVNSVPFQWRKPLLLQYASPHSDSLSLRPVLLPRPSSTTAPSISLLLLVLTRVFSISLPKPPPPATSPATILSVFSLGPIPTTTVRSSFFFFFFFSDFPTLLVVHHVELKKIGVPFQCFEFNHRDWDCFCVYCVQIDLRVWVHVK